MTTIDASSPDAVVDSIYRLLSGRTDEPRDWAAYHRLCAPEMRLMPATIGLDGRVAIELFDAESYVRSRAPMLSRTDFYEKDVGRRIDEVGDIAHVWSEYETRHAPDAAVFDRGVCSFQLVRRDQRWWIVSALWQVVR